MQIAHQNNFNFTKEDTMSVVWDWNACYTDRPEDMNSNGQNTHTHTQGNFYMCVVCTVMNNNDIYFKYGTGQRLTPVLFFDLCTHALLISNEHIYVYNIYTFTKNMWMVSKHVEMFLYLLITMVIRI